MQPGLVGKDICLYENCFKKINKANIFSAVVACRQTGNNNGEKYN
jgi:hypothetical protein